MSLTLLTGLTLLALSGFQNALHGAVFAADFPDTGHGLRDGGTARGSAVGGVHALAGAVDDGRGGSRKRGRGVAGSRGIRRDVAGGADLGESDLKLALDVGALPQEKGEVGAIEPPVLLVLPLEMQLLGALGKVALGIERGGVFLHDERAAGRALLVEGGHLLGLGQGGDDEEQGGGEERFHAGILARVAVFGKVGKKRGSVTRHHQRNDALCRPADSEAGAQNNQSKSL